MYEFALVGERESVEGQAGETVSLLVRLLNTGTATDSYEIRVLDARAGWEVDLCVVDCYNLGPMYSPAVAPGREFRFSLRVRIPENASPGDAFTMRVIARSQKVPQRSAMWQVTVRVLP